MSNNSAYDQRLAELLQDYEKYLDEHGGRVLLRPDITIRLDYMNMTLLSSKVLLELILAQLGGQPPGPPPEPPEPQPPIEVEVRTIWEATEPEEIYNQPILAAGTYYADKMVDCRTQKRIYFLIKSTLDQDVQCQLIGNMTETKDGATDIGPAKICPANDNISVEPTFDQWCPFMGLKMTLSAAPSAGILTISVVKQE